MNDHVAAALEPIMERIREGLADKHRAREESLSLCRDALRHSANAVRAVHRGDFDEADRLIHEARTLLDAATRALEKHPDIYYAGFVHDAKKEYAEACLTLAVIAGRPIPRPEDLDVEIQAYLNGMGEAVGELRRYLLDQLRHGAIDRCEQILGVMDEMYGYLVTFDYPDALTAGLRRTTDAVRGILERTRGDFTVGARQWELEAKLAEFTAKFRV